MSTRPHTRAAKKHAKVQKNHETTKQSTRKAAFQCKKNAFFYLFFYFAISTLQKTLF